MRIISLVTGERRLCNSRRGRSEAIWWRRLYISSSRDCYEKRGLSSRYASESAYAQGTLLAFTYLSVHYIRAVEFDLVFFYSSLQYHMNKTHALLLFIFSASNYYILYPIKLFLLKRILTPFPIKKKINKNINDRK